MIHNRMTLLEARMIHGASQLFDLGTEIEQLQAEPETGKADTHTPKSAVANSPNTSCAHPFPCRNSPGKDTKGKTQRKGRTEKGQKKKGQKKGRGIITGHAANFCQIASQ